LKELDFLVQGGLVHGNNDVVLFHSRQVAIFAQAQGIPGGQPLDVGRKYVLCGYGIPMRKRERIKVVLAVALPEPLTVLKVMQKSLMINSLSLIPDTVSIFQ